MTSTRFELTEKMVGKLKNLIQLDIDASFAYAHAIDGIELKHAEVKAELERFKGDHERHILELSNVLGALGHEPPEYERDFKGFLIEGMTAVRSALGTRQSLKAMQQNELLTNRRYQDALELLADLPPDVLELVRRARDDERRHLEFIERTLALLAAPAPAARA